MLGTDLNITAALFLHTLLLNRTVDCTDNIAKIRNWFIDIWNSVKEFFTGKSSKHSEFNCGIPDVGPQFKSGRYKRITGGDSSRWHSWPWLVSIMSRKTLRICGGSLISPDIIITAAHCVRYEKPSDLMIAVGVHSLLGKLNPINYKRAKQIIIYDDYKYPCRGDIALIQLGKPLNKTSKINIVCLPKTKINLENKDAVVVGWGIQTPTKKWYSTGSFSLKQGEVTIVPNDICNDNNPNFNEDDQMCAFNNVSNVDVRSGDSGGPLMVKINGIWTLVGVASHAIESSPIKPGFYSR
ncbi:hypothetical protein GJ496_003567, partial [Pomphorhynchus laevis]